MDTLAELEQRLRQLETAIEDINRRLPAHSVKPSHVANLFDMEDEYEHLARAIEALNPKNA